MREKHSHARERDGRVVDDAWGVKLTASIYITMLGTVYLQPS